MRGLQPTRKWARTAGVAGVSVLCSLVLLAPAQAATTPENGGGSAPCAQTGTGQGCVVGAGTQLQYGLYPPATPFAMGVFGTGPAAQGFFAFTIAGNGPNGTNQTYVARATCLVVAANTATATGIIFYPSTSAGQRVVMQAVDNGGGNPPRDLLRFSFAGFIHQDPSDPTGRCWIPTLPPAPIESGHIIVGHTPSESGGNGG